MGIMSKDLDMLLERSDTGSVSVLFGLSANGIVLKVISVPF